MSLRTWINENHLASAIVAIIVIAVALGAVVWQAIPRGGSTGGSGQAAATIDDGLTWFRHDGIKVPPFDYNGKTAFGVLLYEAEGKKFVGLMTRYSPEAKKAIEDARAAKAEGKVSAMIEGKAEMAKNTSLEIKKPGEDKWQLWPTGQMNGRPLPAVVSATGKPASPVEP